MEIRYQKLKGILLILNYHYQVRTCQHILPGRILTPLWARFSKKRISIKNQKTVKGKTKFKPIWFRSWGDGKDEHSTCTCKYSTNANNYNKFPHSTKCPIITGILMSMDENNGTIINLIRLRAFPVNICGRNRHQTFLGGVSQSTDHFEQWLGGLLGVAFHLSKIIFTGTAHF